MGRCVVNSTKTCTFCQSEFPKTTEFFSRRSVSPDGFHPRCKKCARKTYPKAKPGCKVCCHCKQELPHNQFSKDSRSKSGLSSRCKTCDKLPPKTTYTKRQPTTKCRKCHKVLPSTKEYFEWCAKTNRCQLRCKQCRKKYAQAYYHKNKTRILTRNKSYDKRNSSKIKKAKRKRYHQKYKHIAEYKLVDCVRSRIRQALNGAIKSDTSLKLIGCTATELKQYLESKFTKGMDWDNYGNSNGDHTNCWHVDHIIPCASFDLTSPQEQKKCFHYTNLQPLWGKDNLRKGTKTTI